jgi:hypothetical protein
MCYSVGFVQGIELLQNNPAISVFEIVFKPLAIGVFISIFPEKAFADACCGIKRIAIALLVMFGLLTVGLVAQDALTAVKERVIAPYDFPNAEQITFFDYDAKLRERVKNEKAKSTDKGNKSEKNVIMVDCSYDGLLLKKTLPAADCYKKYTDIMKEKKDLKPGFVSGVSAAAIWVRFFTFTSVAFIAVTFWYLLVFAYSRSTLPTTSFESLLLTYGFIIAWFPLRMYSEWYANFEKLDLNNYPAFYFAALFAVLFLGLLFWMNTKNVLVKSMAAGISGLSILFAIIAKFDQEMFNSIAELYKKIGWVGFLGLILILTVFLFAPVMNYEKGEQQDQKEEGRDAD